MKNDADFTASTDTAQSLERRWQRWGLHRASRAATPETWSTGWARLDAVLPGGGYPLAAVTEFLVEQPGQGELSLVLKALRPQLEAQPDRRLVFVDPPYRMNAPALDAAGIDRSRVPVIRCRNSSQRLWSIEQLAAAGGFSGLILWAEALATVDLRRLQLASEKAGCPVFVYRPLAYANHRSPAALRLAIQGRGAYQRIEIIKCRGPVGACITGLSAGRDQPWAGMADNAYSATRTTAANEYWAQITQPTRPGTLGHPTDNVRARSRLSRSTTLPADPQTSPR
ncbi:translesion DNA synthesis-associated protein ImuA [Salinisphaera sp. SPP-AMP-43]|uniref:translesion DNA synthesis-associated protein ImuA n=1 Tax=Salinisphaera sp. SPP-AMP-43 TaxID=3121288 RepID=UPI003C6E7D1B